MRKSAPLNATIFIQGLLFALLCILPVAHAEKKRTLSTEERDVLAVAVQHYTNQVKQGATLGEIIKRAAEAKTSAAQSRMLQVGEGRLKTPAPTIEMLTPTVLQISSGPNRMRFEVISINERIYSVNKRELWLEPSDDFVTTSEKILALASKSRNSAALWSLETVALAESNFNPIFSIAQAAAAVKSLAESDMTCVEFQGRWQDCDLALAKLGHADTKTPKGANTPEIQQSLQMISEFREKIKKRNGNSKSIEERAADTDPAVACPVNPTLNALNERQLKTDAEKREKLKASFDAKKIERAEYDEEMAVIAEHEKMLNARRGRTNSEFLQEIVKCLDEVEIRARHFCPSCTFDKVPANGGSGGGGSAGSVNK